MNGSVPRLTCVPQSGMNDRSIIDLILYLVNPIEQKKPGDFFPGFLKLKVELLFGFFNLTFVPIHFWIDSTLSLNPPLKSFFILIVIKIKKIYLLIS